MTVDFPPVEVCPVCGNPDTGISETVYSITEFCKVTQDPEHPEWGCGWLRVQRVE